MPYIDSNQDANQNDLFNKALAVGAVAIGAAAAGQMAFKSIAEKWGSGIGKVTEGKQVLKGLYGKEAGNLQKGIVDNVSLPNWTKDGPQYKLINNGNKAPKFNRTDGSAWQKFKSNQLSPTWSVGDDWRSKFMKSADRDLAMFNSQLKNMHKGNFEGYSESKLNMYQGLVDSAEANNINITGRDAVQATNQIYSSDKNFFNRKNSNINNLADDIDITNEMWNNSGKQQPTFSKADIQAEINNRANAEANANTYQDLYNKESNITFNNNRTGGLRDNYSNFWEKADLDNIEKRNPGTYNVADARRDAQNAQRQEINERIAENKVLDNAGVSTRPTFMDAKSKNDYSNWWKSNIPESDAFLGEAATQEYSPDPSQFFK